MKNKYLNYIKENYIEMFRNKDIVWYLEIAIAIFLVINYNFYPFDLVFSRISILSGIIIIILVRHPLTERRGNFLKFIDNILIASSVGIAIYSYFEMDYFIELTGIGTHLHQMVVGTFVMVLLFEATRRIAGPVLPIMALILYGYAIYRGYSYSRIITEIFSYDGIYGIAFSLAISVVFMFLLFGNFLNQANFGNFLLKLGTALVGGMSGGPAKVAVFASSLFGTISGSAVANVVGTGTFTIPMMKKLGFEPAVAGGIEATASTGGQIMPPVMAAAAFLIAEILQIPYLDVAKAALLPAISYYACVYASVDAYAKINNIQGVPKNERPTVNEAMKLGGHLLLVLVFLIFLLVRRIDPLRAAFLTVVFLLPLSYLNKKTRLTIKKILHGFADATEGLLVVGISCATVGSIIACIALTGLSGRIASTIVGVGGENILLVLVLVMVTCIIFGMALPTTASYLVLASIVAPTLIRFNVVPISAHLFILYFAALSGITPPVALAAYAGAGIAGANLLKTSWIAVKIAFVAFVIPYIFVYMPSMVLQGNSPNLFFILLVYCVVLPISLSWGLWGYSFIKKLNMFERFLNLLIAILIVIFSINGLFSNHLIVGYIISTIWIGLIVFPFIKLTFVKKFFKSNSLKSKEEKL